MVHAGCWTHARRKFVDAVKLSPLDEAARRMVSRMDDLFGVDALAREQGFTHEQRHALRQEKSVSILEAMEKDLKGIALVTLKSSALGKAVNYTLTLWKKLNRFLQYPELELSNNLAENSMRGVALGRKNWIHVGSENAGPKVAAILSVIESCRRLGVSAREYLAEVLPGLSDVSIQKVGELTPLAWKSRIQQS